MADKIYLKDVEAWKELNRNQTFSLYDYMFHAINTSHISRDIYFALQELYWPTFIERDTYVFLKENFSIEKFKDLKKDKTNSEFWMNFLSTDPYFENEEDSDKKAEGLSKLLVEIWATKLKRDFPEKSFSVQYLEDKETGDYGLTFYQYKHQII